MAIRTPINRGFKNPRRVFTVNPLVARPYAGGRALKGAPSIPRTKGPKGSQAYPNPPGWWFGPVAEWVVYWYLTTRKHFKEGLDFYYQAPVFAPGLFRNRNFTRVDFLVDLGPTARAGQIGHYSALAMDPFTAFTHPDPQLDKDKRTALELGHYLLIFLEEMALKMNPQRVVDAALKGRDLSNRA